VTWTSDLKEGSTDGLGIYQRLYSADLTIDNTSVAELSAPGTTVGVLPSADILGTLTYTLVDDAGGRFTLAGHILKVANGGALDHEALASHNIVVKATDLAGLSTVQTFTIKVTNVSEAPTGLALTGTSVKELSPDGTAVGLLSATDFDAGDTITYKLTGGDTGRFEIVGNQLRGKKGILFDYEQAKSHKVTVQATDTAGLSTTKTFTIKVGNVSTEKTGGTSGIDIVVGGGGKDTLSGGGGNDRLTGGGSLDTLRGGSGHDRLDGGTGKDTLYGNSGKHYLGTFEEPGEL
jgi:Ca2+-binding RTX toxin-like protein